MKIRKTLERFLVPVVVGLFIGGNVIAAYLQEKRFENNKIERDSQNSTLITGYNFNKNCESDFMIGCLNQMSAYSIIEKKDSSEKEINWYKLQ